MNLAAGKISHARNDEALSLSLSLSPTTNCDRAEFRLTEFAREILRSEKFREIASYVFWGGATTLVNIVTYAIATRLVGVSVIPATIIAWCVAVSFAFVTNKFWVFGSKSLAAKTVAREFVAFVSARLTSGGIELLMMWLFVDVLGVNDLAMKIISNVVVIVLNYVFSLFFVFKKTGGSTR
ncbi:MAG: GtrA family protein [Opitutae bacterium]|nr:GtrA family protein [Opitutae bacterium]